LNLTIYLNSCKAEEETQKTLQEYSNQSVKKSLNLMYSIHKKRIAMFKFAFAITTFFLCTSSFCQWVTQNSGTTQHLYDVYFIDTQTGWACGDNGTILKTINGGINWNLQNTSITEPVETVHFNNAFTGWAGTRVTGRIIKTTNGGTTWVQQYQSSSISILSLYFLDSLIGWTTGEGLPFEELRTSNGGSTWDSIDVTTGRGNSVFFINPLTGWVSIASSIYKSTNGGASWFFQFQEFLGEIAGISFVNQNTGWLLFSETWIVYKTTSGGSNWFLQDTLVDCFNAHSIQFTNVNTGWISGDCGQIFSTTNGGLNWYQENTGTNFFLNSVYFVNDTVGWSVGGTGKIIHTSNGGAILPVENVSIDVPKDFRLYQNYPNPFNSETEISFDIPLGDNYSLTIYNTLGQSVKVLFDEYRSAGRYNTNFNAGSFASGVYFYELKSKIYCKTNRFILLK
jgi:photosystem II stability/assembly factor-like uncharacterized protein